MQDVPEHAPDHPTNVEPGAGFAINVTVLFVGKLALQRPPQSMPLGALVTVPFPDPFFSTVKVDIGTGATASKMAVTD